MERTHLSLVPFSKAISSESVRSLIARMGYHVEVLRCDDWIEAPTPHQDDISVLLLDNDDLQSDKLRKRLNNMDRSLAFAIIEDEKIAEHNGLLNLCDDFTTWPCCEQELVCRLERLFGAERVAGTDTVAGQIAYSEFDALNLTGRSARFTRALQLVRKMAGYDTAVLIEGETGTGKEVTARAIHYLGARRDNPFVPVNCGAIPDNLLENELFGHEKGAYTDAKSSQLGLIAEANGGSLFLDEIDALSPKAQVALLRFLQDKQYRPLGSKRYRCADVRIIAATNADIRKQVERGQFREDLYFRINVLSMTLPPLRERSGDIRLLAQKFLDNCKENYNQPEKYLHKNTLKWLDGNRWPGNVRELENTIHRLFLLADGPAIYCKHSNIAGQERRQSIPDRRMHSLLNMSFNQAKSLVISEFERNYLTRLMQETHGNVSKAARIVGKERRALGKLLKKYQIKYR